MPAHTFLTGATGFIGAAVAKQLVAKGHKLRILARPNSNRRNLQALDVEIVEGDLTNPQSYRGALHGCRYLFHVAADYRIWVPNVQAMHSVNVGGTVALMQEALAAGIERVIYTSSVCTIGLTQNGTPACENTLIDFSKVPGVYKRSKFLAELEVQRMIVRNGLPAIIVNPSAPLGCGDIKPTPTGRIVVDAISGRMPAYVDTGLNIVHVDDVALGHYLALERGKIGERYILGGENLTLAELLALIAETGGPPAPKLKLPRKAIYPVAFCMEIIAHLLGCEPRISVDALRMAKHHMFFSSAKAERELGYRARPVHLAVAEAVAWFRSEGYM